MATGLSSVFQTDWTLADFWTHLGGIPPERIRMFPMPGTATENDVLEVERQTGCPCELIDGTLVEKTVGYYESFLAVKIICLLQAFVETHDLGIVLGEAGTLKVLPDQVRVPDACFISWNHFPNRELPPEPIPDLAPDLAIEVLSAGNTASGNATQAARLLHRRRETRVVHRSRRRDPRNRTRPKISSSRSMRTARSPAATCCPASSCR